MRFPSRLVGGWPSDPNRRVPNPIEVPVPAAAIGEAVLIEFNFVSEGSLDAFSGLCLDNVKVQIP